MTSTTIDQAVEDLLKGSRLDVTIDVAEQALAQAIPKLFHHVDPTNPDGRGSLSRFRRLLDNAGLPHDHAAFAGWLAIRAMAVRKDDAVICRTGCGITEALLAGIGAVDGDGAVEIVDAARDGALSITWDEPLDGEKGAIATPGGTIRFPGVETSCPGGTLATALSAVEAVAIEGGRRAYDEHPNAVVELAWTRPTKHGSIDADSIHEDWMPEIATHPDLVNHPSRLIQSATLSTVMPPEVSYRPRLPRRVIRSGLISDAQFDLVVAAGAAHQRHLPVAPDNEDRTPRRVGHEQADGTGTGKTHELLGIALDNALHGRRRTILVIEKKRHLSGFVSTWTAFGQNPADILPLWALDADDQINLRSGILVMTYSMLREWTKSAGHIRVAQVAAWATTSFDGPMLFDEAQCMRNAAGNEDRSGKRSAISGQGLGGVALQDALPDARVVYASATGGTDVHNLGYCSRLGLWGEGSAFKTRAEFIAVFESGDIADLEQVTLSLKASGVYVARSLSFEGVEVVNLPVTLTKDERRTFNEAAEMWKRLKESVGHLASICNSPANDPDTVYELRQKGLKGAIPYSALNGYYESSRKASMSTLIASFKARGVIQDAEKRIAEGMSVVVQMQNTYEAQLTRALGRVEDPNDVDLQPSELVSFAEALPVQMYDIVNVPDPKDASKTIKTFRVRLDDKGDPVDNPTAVALRDDLIAECKGMKLPLPPLDQIVLHFGGANVSEVTGRNRRLAPVDPQGSRHGNADVRIEDRTEEDRRIDIELFHDAKRSVLAFSTDAGGSSLSYHAKVGTAAGDRRRAHYLIQLGYRADQVTQGIGRTHRSDQTMPPMVSLVTVDLPADRLYASRIVSNLFKLGALTQGHRQATSNGMFDERDCLDGPYAEKAWQDLQQVIYDGGIPGYTWAKFMQDMNLNLNGTATVKKWDKEEFVSAFSNVNLLINRVAALGDRRQNLIFDKLRELIDRRIEEAMSDGTFKSGPEVLKAKSLTILADRRLKTDRIHGGHTRLLRVRVRSEASKTNFGEAYRRYMRDRTHRTPGFFAKHRTTGQFALIAPARPMETALGERVRMSDVITPTGTSTRPTRFVEREPWIPFSNMDDRLDSMWTAAVEAAASEETTYLTIVADALLPVWPTLYKASEGRDAVYRFAADDGTQIVGRPIATRHYPAFCAGLGESSKPEDAEVDDVMEALKDGATIAVSSASKTPHLLVGDWTGSRMTGASLIMSAGYSLTLGAVLDMLPGADSKRAIGQKCAIAIRAKDVRDAVTAILSICPATYVESDSMRTRNAKAAAAAAAAATAAQAAAAAKLAA
jgi:hypothetical protein